MGGRVLWLLALTGCANVWRVDYVDPPPPDSAIDAPTCANGTYFHETLTDTMKCASWGQPIGDDATDTITQGNGQLVIAKTMAGSTYCVAIATTPFDDRGIFVAVDQTLTNLNGKSIFVVGATMDLSSPTNRWTIAISGGGEITFNVTGVPHGMKSYAASDMRFVRLRTDGTTAVVGETSPDAVAWTELGRDAETPPAFVYTALSNYQYTAPSGTDTTTFSHFNVCP